jgi:hypothetical protein
MGNDFSLIALAHMYSCKIYVTSSGLTQPVPTIGAVVCEINIAHYHVTESRYLDFASTRPLDAVSGVGSGGNANLSAAYANSVGRSAVGTANSGADADNRISSLCNNRDDAAHDSARARLTRAPPLASARCVLLASYCRLLLHLSVSPFVQFTREGE